MKTFKAGEVISIRANVLRMRGDKVEAQTADGQLLRIPAEDAMLVPTPKDKSKGTPERKDIRMPDGKASGTSSK